jgi:hypothetical protein
MGEDPGGGEDRQRLLARLAGVLGRERVDRGSDHGDPFAREALPGKPGAGEHERVRVEHVASQEVPGLAGIVVGIVVGMVKADVAAPNHGRARRAHRRGETGRLRIMEDHDVLRLNEPGELGGVRSHCALVDLLFA